MRLWTIHPKYLDSTGLVALWREALLAQKVLAGLTRGYRHHPQLIRFRHHKDPLAAIGTYLLAVHDESLRRSFNFDRTKINPHRTRTKIYETKGQLLYEWAHLRSKLWKRDRRSYGEQKGIVQPDGHPLFRVVSGGIRDWEKQG